MQQQGRGLSPLVSWLCRLKLESTDGQGTGGFAWCKNLLRDSENKIKEEGEMSLDEWGDTVNTGLYPLAQTRGEILSFCQQHCAS